MTQIDNQPFTSKKDIVSSFVDFPPAVSLSRFLNALNYGGKLSCSIEEFVLQSECDPILDMFNLIFNNNAEVAVQKLFLSVLDRILVIARENPTLKATGISIFRKILNLHIKSIYLSLDSSSKILIQKAYQLLTTICTFGNVGCKEIQENFNFKLKAFEKHPFFKYSKNESEAVPAVDIRILFRNFALAFFKHGCSTVKSFILQIKDFGLSIFKTLHFDSYEGIKEVLDTFHQTVILDDNIPRSIKISFFNTYFLNLILKLYNETKKRSEDEIYCVADLAHQFLLNICTIPGKGVCFQDGGWYTPLIYSEDFNANENSDNRTRKYYNFTLLNFLPQLKPWSNMKQQQLCLKILQSCPELVQPYCFNVLKNSMEPRLTLAWISNANFLQKIILLPIPSFFPKEKNQNRKEKNALHFSSPPKLEVLLHNVCPPQLTRIVFSKGLLSNTPLVSYTTAILLLSVLRKYSQLQQKLYTAINSFQQRANSERLLDKEMQISIYNWNIVKNSLRSEFKKLLPEPTAIFSIEKHCIFKHESKSSLLLTVMFQIVKELHELFPELITESNIDLGRFISTDIESLDPSIQSFVIEVISISHSVKWFLKSKETKSISSFGKLVKLFCQAGSDILENTFISAISRILYNTGTLTELSCHEIFIWLSNVKGLCNNNSKLESTIRISLFETAMLKLDKEPSKYLDKQAAICNFIKETLHEDMAETSNSDYNFENFSPLVLCVIDALFEIFREKQSGRCNYSEDDLNNMAKFLVESIAIIYFSGRTPWKQRRIYLSHLLKEHFLKRFSDLESALPYFSTVEEVLIIIENGDDEIEINRNVFKLIFSRLNFSNLNQWEFPFLCISTLKSGNILDFISDGYLLLSFNKYPMSLKLGMIPHLFHLISQELGTQHPKLNNGSTWFPFLNLLLLNFGHDNALMTDVHYNNFIYAWIHSIKSLSQLDDQVPSVNVDLIIALPAIILQELKMNQHHCISDYNMAIADRIFAELFNNNKHLNMLSCWIPYVMNDFPLSRMPNLLKMILSKEIELGPRLLEAILKDPHVYKTLSHEVLSSVMKLLHQLLNRNLFSNRNHLFNVTNYLLALSDQLSQNQDFVSLCKHYFVLAFDCILKDSSDILIFLHKDCQFISLMENQLYNLGQKEVMEFFIGFMNSDFLTRNNFIECFRLFQLVMDYACQHWKEDQYIIIQHHFIKKYLPLISSLLENPQTLESDQLKILCQIINIFGSLMKNSLDVISKECIKPLIVDIFSSPYFLNHQTIQGVIKILLCVKEEISDPNHFLNLVFQKENLDDIMNNDIRLSFSDSGLNSIPAGSQTRESLSKLIYTLFMMSPESCCNIQNLLRLFPLYWGTTSIADRHLLAVFQLYETKERISVSRHSFFWGPCNPGLTPHLEEVLTNLTLPSSAVQEIISSIQPNWMMKTIEHFPSDHNYGVEIDEYGEVPSNEEVIVYDPSFLLSFFANLFHLGGQFNVRRWIEANGLGFCCMCLSSVRENIRRASFFVLDEFASILEASSFREKTQVEILMNFLRNSITDRTQRIPSVICVFFAKALQVILRPEHFMYPHVNEFCLLKPFLDAEDIPLLHTLIYSSGNDCSKKRQWLLHLLLSGLRHSSDYEIYKRSYVFDILCSMYNSSITDRRFRKLTLDILLKAVSIPYICKDMVVFRGLLPWLKSVDRNLETDVHRLTLSNIYLKASNTIETEKEAIDKHQRYSKSNSVLCQHWALFSPQIEQRFCP